ncbi:MAG: hypothetical protein ACR2HD_05495 [Solirubrobacteraceae bacterium]|nr:MAG: hypothetical protein DLM63_00050 [Solirubrobacterales bacterium]
MSPRDAAGKFRRVDIGAELRAAAGFAPAEDAEPAPASEPPEPAAADTKSGGFDGGILGEPALPPVAEKGMTDRVLAAVRARLYGTGTDE